MQRYESYKPSGVYWMGNIPADWEIKKFRYAYTKSNAGEVIDKSHWHFGNELLFTCQKTPMQSGYSKFDDRRRTRSNDLLLTRNGTPYVHLPPDGAIYSNVVQRVHLPESYNRKFVWYALSNSCQHLSGYGDIIESFNMSTWNNLVFPVPPRPTQDRIVAFLDQKSSEIDVTIAKKAQLIELLDEQKTILINKAVRQGLNLDVQQHESGIEWIGKIPSHWQVKRAKYLFREIDERSVSGEEELLSVSHITGVTPRSEKTNIYMFMAEDYSGSKLCRPNDLVFNIMWAWMGALGVSDRAGIVSPSYGVYRQLKEGSFNGWYLENLLRSTQYVAEYNKRSTGLHSSRLRLYSHMFFDMELGFPPREEQDEIERETKRQVSQIDALTTSVRSEIEKLLELRSSLVESVVTGKIRV